MSLGLGLTASKLNDQLEWEKQGKETKKCPDRNHQCLVLKNQENWGVSGRRKWPAGLGALLRTQRKCEQVARVTKVLVMVVNAAAGEVGEGGSRIEGAEE